MSYTFIIDRGNGTWTAENPSGTQIDSGDLPLSTQQRQKAILHDKGVSDPVLSALVAAFAEKDWRDEEL